MLTGQYVPGLVDDALCNSIKPYVSSTVKVVCHSPPTHVPGFWRGNDWFEYETTHNLPSAVAQVERHIEDMIDDGIDSRNIVLVGMSQGGAVALYTALNTYFKLGGVVGLITWLPRLPYEGCCHRAPVELPENKRGYVANANTPVLHINGLSDTTIPIEMGYTTRDALSKVMWDYDFRVKRGEHGNCCVANPIVIREIIKWLNEKTNVSVRFCWIPFVC